LAKAGSQNHWTTIRNKILATMGKKGQVKAKERRRKQKKTLENQGPRNAGLS
jgi:hypothetical protein